MGASLAIYGLSLFCAILNEVLIPFFIFKSTGDGRILDQGVPTVHVVAYVIVSLERRVRVCGARFDRSIRSRGARAPVAFHVYAHTYIDLQE